MSTLEMPHVSDGSVSACSYNHDGCHAFAIHVSGDNGTAASVQIGAADSGDTANCLTYATA